MKYYKYYLLSLVVILIDQIVKFVVHFNMDMGLPGEIHLIGEWAKLHYTLNPGMAFGVELGSSYGKLILSLFRMVAMVFIGYGLYYLWKHRAHSGFIWCVALILGGAIGNLIDSIFYGIWFDNAPFGSPTPWFHGQVVDMFYLDIWEGIIPYWVPVLGGQAMSLWPIFNVADSAIFIGVLIILFNQKRFFSSLPDRRILSGSPEETPADNQPETTNAKLEA
ncbi:lipoprotein signal peptidase [Adhaeribacter arboris]|uniref:Lipoprotein signal peptidase n=1 Tax=Adhaeribacter arboris TaxID=2072846 RepID=A0A2T2YIH8_9BACT|nr:lipoprotein signal peptidase [Adhaeribacter arboris]PSR55312.1 lipoprotein signal peptidase [Adhaeribacter arboris]